MKIFTGLVALLVIIPNIALSQCDEFVTWVADAKDSYQGQHRLYPVSPDLKSLAVKFMPRLWVHPDSWQPIFFNDYLDNAKLIKRIDGNEIEVPMIIDDLKKMPREDQCELYFRAHDIPPRSTAPVYIQAYWDHNPANPNDKWVYIKYNFVFDWSGLAQEIGSIAWLGSWLSGGDQARWHRLDIHIAAILAFDSTNKLRMLTLAQHNHQQTFLPDVDFPSEQRPQLVAAIRSNELYLDRGQSGPVSHRVVPFFTDIAFLVDARNKPWFWAHDVTYGRNAGGKEVTLQAVFIEPKHPLEDFSGLLAPPNRLLGFYTGRDGPPGYNYYALPTFISLSNFAAIGFWKEGDTQLLEQLQPLLKGFKDTQWERIVDLMRNRLVSALKK